MRGDFRERLSGVLSKVDRPGSFCVAGSAPAVLPGLEVEGMGPVGLPLTAKQAKELIKHCHQAPHGKGECRPESPARAAKDSRGATRWARGNR